MRASTRGSGPSDVLVLFGITGDLAYKQIFPALYAMTKRGVLKVPVVGVASSMLNLAELRRRATESITKVAGSVVGAPCSSCSPSSAM